MLCILRMDVSDWNQRASMQKSQLSALSILFFDETFSQRTFTGNITFQPVSKLFVDTEGKSAEVMRYFCRNTIVFMKSGNYRVVFLKRIREVNIQLGDLKPGEYRELTQAEEVELRRIVQI